MKQLLNTSILIILFSFTNNTRAQINLLNDEFNTSELDASWNLFNTQYYQTPVPVVDGKMVMNLDDVNCNRTCVWWLDQNAGLIYKNVTGDFDVVAAVYAKQKTNPDQDIDNWTQLAGLIARDPASTTSGLENYVFNVAGIRFGDNSVEIKSTTNNLSSIRPHTDNMSSGSNAEVRMIREGALFSLYSRPIGGQNWMFRNSFTRPDLPETLQVGLIAYVFEAYPGNLLAQFDYIRFSEVDDTLGSPDFNKPTAKVKIYPNPATSVLNVEAEKADFDEITIYNVLGTKVHQLKTNATEENLRAIKLNISNLSKGIYFLEIKKRNKKIGNYKFSKN